MLRTSHSTEATALAAELSDRLGIRATASNFAVKFGTPPDPQAIESMVLGLVVADADRMVSPVSESAVEGLKFSECLPAEMAMRVVQTRLTDVVGTEAILGRCTRLASNGSG